MTSIVNALLKLHSGVHLIPWPHLSLKLSLVFTWLPPAHPQLLIDFSFFPLLVSITILQNLTLNYWSHKVTKLLTIPELNSFHKTFTKSSALEYLLQSKPPFLQASLHRLPSIPVCNNFSLHYTPIYISISHFGNYFKNIFWLLTWSIF